MDGSEVGCDEGGYDDSDAKERERRMERNERRGWKASKALDAGGEEGGEDMR